MIENDIIRAKQIEKYNTVAMEHAHTSGAVLWDDPQTQYLRFHELARHLNLDDSSKSLLDIGCGNGELYKYLNFQGYRGHYVGYDINEILLAQARERFESIEVKCVDILVEEPIQRFDYVVLSGLFNVNVGQTMDWLQAFIKRMFEMTNQVMVFNAISSHVSYRDDGMYYMDPAEILTFCVKNLSKRTTLMHHNLPYNYTVAVFKDESWSSVKETIA